MAHTNKYSNYSIESPMEVCSVDLLGENSMQISKCDGEFQQVSEFDQMFLYFSLCFSIKMFIANKYIITMYIIHICSELKLHT